MEATFRPLRTLILAVRKQNYTHGDSRPERSATGQPHLTVSSAQRGREIHTQRGGTGRQLVGQQTGEKSWGDFPFFAIDSIQSKAMSSTKKMQQIIKEKEEEPEVPRCDFCHQPGLSLKDCAGCGCEKYCDSTCQKARWPHHKAECKAKRTERERGAKAKEAGKEQGSSRQVRDKACLLYHSYAADQG